MQLAYVAKTCYNTLQNILYLMHNNISACSVLNLFLCSSYRMPAPENRHSDGTLVGGELKKRLAKF